MSRMRRLDWLSSKGRRPVRGPRPARLPGESYHRRLHIEALEDRRMLAFFTVTSLDDAAVTMAGDAPGTLRQAIFDANAAGTGNVVNFFEGLSGTILLTEGELAITESMTISGPGAVQLTIDASGSDPTPDEDLGDGSRIFNIDDGADMNFIDVKIIALTLTGGDADAIGGAIRSLEDLTLRDSLVTGNSAYATAGFFSGGGGIYSTFSTVTIENSTFSNNRTYHDDVSFGGAILLNTGDLTMINSTISGNVADSAGAGATYGGGIALGNGAHLIAHSTIADNDSDGGDSYGGGLFVSALASTTLDHTIVGNNFASVGRDISSSNLVFVEARYSLVENAAGWMLDDDGGNIIGLDPGLPDDLAYHGGPTPVYRPLPDSPVIDAGDPILSASGSGSGGIDVVDYDQRGAPFERIADGDGDMFARIDIGAYERQTVAGLNLVVDIVDDEIDDDYTAGDLSLREAVGLANGSIGPDTITFAPELGGQTILLTNGELWLLDDVTIDSTGAGVVTIDASGNDPTPSQNLGDGSRVFDIRWDDNGFDSPLTATLRGLYLTGGDVSYRGGAVNSEANLNLSHVTIAGNHTFVNGGGLMQRGSDAVLTIENSTISNNLATNTPAAGAGSGQSINGRGGGLQISNSAAEIINSTISGNRALGDFSEGGGLLIINSNTTIRHSTITGNSTSGNDTEGGNISFRGDSLALEHTIVANGMATAGNDIDAPFDPVTANFSWIEDATGLTIQGGNNTTGTDPKLGPLADNGGVTKTHALLPGNVLTPIDGGQFTFTPPPAFDQRGGPFVRRFDGNDDTFDIIDVGAYERQTVEMLNLVVDTNVDESDGNYTAGDLSLREAIGLANGSIGSDTITFAADMAGKTILLTLGELQIVDDVAIDATGLGGRLTVDASGNDPTPLSDPDGDGSRVFNINDGDDANFIDVELSGLTLTGGDIQDFDGGGAILNAENLTVNQSTISGNAAMGILFGTPGNIFIFGGRGGGIHVTSGGTLSLEGSTVDSNEAAYGGGLSIDEGQLTITSSTISSNRASDEGGGIWATGGGTAVTVNHSTIAANGIGAPLLSGEGGGVRAEDMATVSLNHTIVADNFALVGTDISSTTSVSFFYGLVENGSGFTPSGGPQFIGDDPLLAPLADNGGPTETHALKAGSPAIDVGNLAFTPPPAFDQRGGPFVRRFDGNGDTFDIIDIGAYERQTLPDLNLVVNTTSDVVDGDFGPGELSLREAVGLANGSIGVDTITFATALSGETIALVQGQMQLLEDVTIDAASLAQNVTVDASGSDPTPDEDQGDGSRIFLVTNNIFDNFIDVELSGLTLIGGDVTGNGGAVFNDENLTINESTISGNAASTDSGSMASAAGGGSGDIAFDGNGGGVAHLLGELVIDSSTISGNSALGPGHGGGIAATSLSTFTLRNSTVSGNFASIHGGGIYLNSFDSAELLHSTVTENEAAGSGGGVIDRSSGGNLSLNHTIVANNQADVGPDISAGSVPLVYSLVEDVGGFTPTDGPRITGQDPMLGPLANNGGPTQTHALLFGSPAIDAGQFLIVSPPDFDQRGAGFARIVDGNGDTFPVIDIGAYEYDPNAVILVGDYNDDGTVDAADYTVYRDHRGQVFSLINESPLATTPGEVDQEDYDFWVANFGQTLPPPAAGSGSLASSSPVVAVADEAFADDAAPLPSLQTAVAPSIETASSPTAAVDRALLELTSLRRFTRSAPIDFRRDLLTARFSNLSARVHAAAVDRLLLIADRRRDDSTTSDRLDAPVVGREATPDDREPAELVADIGHLASSSSSERDL